LDKIILDFWLTDKITQATWGCEMVVCHMGWSIYHHSKKQHVAIMCRCGHWMRADKAMVT